MSKKPSGCWASSVLKKLRSLEVCKFVVFKKWLLQYFVGLENYDIYRWNFICPDFINPLSWQAAKLLNFGKSLTAFTMADRLSRTYTFGCKLAFTMAEILISLTIIGIIAAITLPALQANINESAWKAQRKALYSRMTQAISMMPSLNGYGDFTGEWADDVVTPTTDTAAERFVTDGLAKVLNINNICSIPMSTTNPVDRHKELAKCGIPDKLTTMANSKMPFPTNLAELNPMFTSTFTLGSYSYNQPQKNINTNAAAFETKNGESITVFYNPYCQSDMGETTWHYSQPKMCANFVYDLNGRKGPNKVGKDIGFITALYPVDFEIVAPIPLTRDAKVGSDFNLAHTVASAACRAQEGGSRVPNRDELAAMFYNKQLLGAVSQAYWAATIDYSADKAWRQQFDVGTRYIYDSQTPTPVRCVKK